jgi:protein phosphatase
LKVKAAGRSVAGAERNRNEDVYSLDASLGLFIIADGMGGAAGGAFASRLAATVIDEHVRRAIGTWAAPSLLMFAVEQANRRVRNAAQYDAEREGMGTTVAAVLARRDRFTVAHVGDSRVYRATPRTFERLTHDHSTNAELVRRGLIAAEHARGNMFDGALMRVVGPHETVDVDVCTVEAAPGDVVLLCSDGLHGVLQDEEMARVLWREEEPADAADRLMALALQKRPTDDTTLVVVRWSR